MSIFYSDLSSLHLNEIAAPKRTDGDGMENTVVNKTLPVEISKFLFGKTQNLRDQLIYRPDDLKGSYSQPPQVQGKIIELCPKSIKFVKNEGKLKLSAISAREPKFVPYEPYKAAVKPIVPITKSKVKKKIKTLDPALESLKENTILAEDIQKTVLDNLHDSTSSNSLIKNKTLYSNSEWEIEKATLEDELKQLRQDNEQLENQLKFQAQVNCELKNLLVAAVGEDLQTRVHILTEDKLQLARALLNSAQKLSTHQEQTEWLAGQCEVWRSRFLASSIMVEEMAKWKAALNQKTVDLQECVKKLLEERMKVRECLLPIYRDVSVLCDNFDVTSLRSGIRKLSTSHMVDLSNTIKQLSTVLRLQLLGDDRNTKYKEPDLTGLDTLTLAEKNAEQLLKHPLPLLGRDDSAYSAVMGAAVALGASHLFPTPAPTCCAHCSGEVKQL
uniref:Golgin-45 n=1 Tax=Clastoptera arizonana TaxID=38151 RepID=A0A1B6DZD2_9HEMI